MTRSNATLKTHYIFVMGGVLSGLGKGIATSSLALLLQQDGFRVTAMKIDPYINVDAGTMNPTEHGETFVTKDGLETDQDIGNYERFLHTELSRDNYMTQGMVWQSVIAKERNLEYNGRCVQPWHHIPEEVIRRITSLGKKTKSDFVLVEIGGTVGEYENLIFLEAARRLRIQCPDQVLFAMVSYLPVPSKIGEMKTKPTQTAVQILNAAGIQPNFILTRSEQRLDEKRKEKISMYCSIAPDDVISSEDVDTIYQVPLLYKEQKFDDRVLEKFKLKKKSSGSLKTWKKQLVTVQAAAKKTVRIAMVGKYFSTGSYTLVDSYISVVEAIKAASWEQATIPEFAWIDSIKIEKGSYDVSQLSEYDAIVVPGGFGTRGVEGIISAISYVRTHEIPFLGLCYGMQLATIEFARSVAGLTQAHTLEVKPNTKHPVITIMYDQKDKLAEQSYGGTMRLGNYQCNLIAGTIAARAYKKRVVHERHRHRYEFNNEYRDQLTTAGLVVSGENTQRNLVEIIELPTHPFFVGAQFHPELRSHPLNPHPLFRALIRAALAAKK